MRVIFPMFIMLIGGLSLGAGGMTLYWSGVADRGFKREAEWRQISETFKGLAEQNLATSRRTTASLNECLTLVKSR